MSARPFSSFMFAGAAPPAETETWLRLIGRLHPLVVHFPIALIVLAGLIELMRFVRRTRGPRSSAAWLCLSVGAASAIVGAWFGWLHAEYEPQSRTLARFLLIHRWVGVATASFASVALWLAWLDRNGTRERASEVYRMCLFLAVVLVGVGGHLGNILVRGEGYLTEVFNVTELENTEPDAPPGEAEPPIQAGSPPGETGRPPDEVAPEPTEVLTAQGETSSGAEDLVDLGEPAAAGELGPQESTLPADAIDDQQAARTVDFHSDIAPIFGTRCIECHGQYKKKAGLRLDRRDDVFAGDEPIDWLINPGSSAKSYLFELVVKPADDPDRMPANGDPLTPAQIELLRVWIEEGAHWPQGAAGLIDSDKYQSAGAAEAAGGAAASALPTVSLAPVTRPPDLEAQLLALEEAGAYARPVAQNTNDVQVNWSRLGAEIGDEALTALVGLEEELVWLDLSSTAITDAGLARLANFRALRRLRLDRTGIGDAGLVHLVGLARLESLNLYGTNVTDAGLMPLADLEELAKLYVWQTAVTEDGAETFASARPDVTVVRDVIGELPELPDPAAGEEASGTEGAGGTEAPDAEGPEERDAPSAKLVAACCETARAAGGVCDHECCVAAALTGEVCPKCGAQENE